MIVRVRQFAFLAAVAVAFLATATGQNAAWLDIPFVSQPENGCGAAVISMTMRFWNAHGTKVAPELYDVGSIQRQLYSPSDRGIKASAMTRYFSDHGFRAFAFRGDERDLEQHLAKGRPLIVALKESSGARVLHYLVVAGLDPAEKVVLVNDPAQRKLLKMELADFQRAWAGTDYWTLLVVPKT